MAQNVRTPAPIDLSAQRVAVGDTTEFVQKINATQTEFERYSNDLGDTTSDMMLLATDLEQKAGQVATDRQTVEADKAIVAAAKATIAADKAATAADVQTVAADKVIVAADKQTVADHKQAAELAVQQAEQEKNLTIAEKNLAIQARQGAETALSQTQTEAADAAQSAQNAQQAQQFVQGVAANFDLPVTPAVANSVLVQKADASGFEYRPYQYNHDASDIVSGTFSGYRLPLATSNVQGGVKVRLSGTTAYITTNGSNA